MIIEFEGRAWEFDPKTITVDEWRQFKRIYQMTPSKFEEGVKEGDPDAYTFLYWIMLRRTGNQMVSLGDHLKPDIIALNAAVAAATEDEPEPEQPEPEPEPVPTFPPGSEASPAAAFPPTTTPPSSLPAQPPPAASPGSGMATSSSSAPSTSVPSLSSATSTSPGLVSSP